MGTLQLQSLEKRYGNDVVVDRVSLEVGESEFVALLGPSGCGKTTVLRLVAGFVEPSAGRILVAGTDVTQMPPHKRNTAMVFQSYALFPHMTVAQNVAFGLRMRGLAPQETESRSREALQLVRLDEYAGRYPRELSGGQQQRVAVARALVVRPDVFLLDEPLSNLDAKLRQSVGQELRALQRSLGLTTVFVTHDQAEALALADRVVIMNAGRVEQVGTATEIYTRPANAFVANFLGRANLLPGRVEGEGEFVTDDGVRVVCDTSGWRAGGRAILCVRPEDIRIGAHARQLSNVFPARRHTCTYLGASTEHLVRLAPSGTELSVHASSRRQQAGDWSEPAGECQLGWDAADARLLPDQ